MKSSPAFESDIELNWGSTESIVLNPKPAFIIPQSIKLNNLPSLKLNKEIK
jgi:hypothetical protein